MDENGDSDPSQEGDEDDDALSVESTARSPVLSARYKAVRKFPLNSHIGKREGADQSGSDAEDEEEEDDDDDEELEAKKLKIAEEEKVLRSIVYTEDFVDFLCYKSYKEPPKVDEQRRILSDFFSSDTIADPETELNDRVKKEVRESNSAKNEERFSNLKTEDSESSRSAPRGTAKENHPKREDRKRKLLKTSRKLSRTVSSSPVKKFMKTPLKDSKISTPLSSQSLKNRLRPSTKASTAATKKELVFNVKRKLSQEFSSEGISADQVKSEVEDGSESLKNCSSYADQPNACNQFKEIAPLEADTKDFSSLPSFISSLLISSPSLPAFLVKPPPSFKMECNISQEVRFSTHNQYIHRMHNRWGNNSVQLACITCHLESQGTIFSSHPLAGGVEIDLAGLSESVGKHGGLQKVIDDVLWPDVIRSMKVPKVARDKISRLYEVYCRYLLSYDTLSDKDKSKLERKVLSSKDTENCDDLCVSKGRCRTLSELYDVARNIASMFDLEEASSLQIMSTYWSIVRESNLHVTVHTGFIRPSDLSTTRRRSSAKNRLNLVSHMRCCDSFSCPMFIDEDVLNGRLEVEMMFSTRCWTRDRHFRGSLSYNHTGADIVWYFVKAGDEEKLKNALKKLAPNLIDCASSYWLPPNVVMLPPEKLMEHEVPVHRAVQQPGQLVVIPPRTFFSSVSCGYSISEHIHFLTSDWLILSAKAASSLQKSCFEPMFSFEKLLMMILSTECYQHQLHSDGMRHFSIKQITQASSIFEQAISRELKLRKALTELGVKRRMERSNSGEDAGSDVWLLKVNNHKMWTCHITKNFCFFSMVKDTQADEVYCLECAAKKFLKRKVLTGFELVLFFNQSELSDIVSKTKKLCGALNK